MESQSAAQLPFTSTPTNVNAEHSVERPEEIQDDPTTSPNTGPRYRVPTSYDSPITRIIPSRWTFHRNFSDINIHTLSTGNEGVASPQTAVLNDTTFPPSPIRRGHRFTDPSGMHPPHFDTKKAAQQMNQTDISSQGWNPDNVQHLKRLRRWLICFCNVVFDIEKGQALESVYPNIEIPELEKKNLCFLAFPDSNTSIHGDITYTFRMRGGKWIESILEGEEKNIEFVYGYVLFRQKKDSRLKRGCFQKSVVLLTSLKLTGLFLRIVDWIGKAFFDFGKPLMEKACAEIARWPDPNSGSSFDLSVLGHALAVHIPHEEVPQRLETTPTSSSHSPVLMSSVLSNGLYSHFRNMLEVIWHLWELVLLNEPIAVFSNNPSICSEVVLSLVDLISPVSGSPFIPLSTLLNYSHVLKLPFSGDYRPYFTIQDVDFKSLVSQNKKPQRLILGVTNAYFLTALESWPHLLKLEHSSIIGQREKKVRNVFKMKPESLFDSCRLGLFSKHKPCIKPDLNLIKMLTQARIKGTQDEHFLNNLLRTHFLDLTEKFLEPINYYFNSLKPSGFNSITAQLQMKPFHREQCIQYLHTIAPKLPFVKKNDYFQLYERFFSCSHFASWLSWRTRLMQQEWKRVQIDLIYCCDVVRWIETHNSADILTFLICIQDDLKNTTIPLSPDQRQNFEEKKAILQNALSK